ncbi:Transcriptional regulator, TetR family (plasmid) [Rhodovulum sp. P5]|uniref:TetR/AcrR family transcriptional regulator n=1 Tax=Rhodovulum sp. P5 TaxID=1564506 RepID=UPI0009C212CC|nr:helix-turn-helix domain-containing protein [Rhodovulum sp. P5]ARE42359.1 Transcriptional regulator, TetR family [Rhodovulum sp. P5]
MTLSLRERRRRQTEREIQAATLDLARTEGGLDSVTVEAIAERAGISPRTFFNYYPHKEAAVLGRPPGFPPEALETLRTGQGALVADLKPFLEAHLAQIEDDRSTLNAIFDLGRSSGRVKLLLDRFLMERTDDLSDCLSGRLPDLPPRRHRLLAEWALRLSGDAIGHWASGESKDLSTALQRAWEDHAAVADMLFDSVPPRIRQP